ncbi:MAG: hypothetical protein CVV18_03895 [Gammaproteobacteria bacterium HGW-Gammaproteobacteria-8]|nr:MAG: hypothetical protein CVV18_03895 [Gammaproteobacteria bacterium HGW-Gammaproteobacteria-8]
MLFVFDRFELDPETHQLIDRDADQILALRPQAFSVLVFLLERAPATVSRDQLLNGVWGHTSLSASGVSQAIREIRKSLGDDANDPRILATRHGCGYQIIAPVGIRSGADEGEASRDSAPITNEQDRLSEIKLSEMGLPEIAPRAQASRQSVWIAAAMVLAPLLALLAALLLTEPASRSASSNAGSEEWAHSGRGLPRSEPAIDAWSAGLQARALFDRDEALRQFKRAWQAAPDSSSALLALINAQVDAGEIIEAGKYLDHELLKRARLSHRERLELRATIARVAGSWSVAADALQSLVDFFPDEYQYALWLFDARMHSAPPQRAGEALAALMPASDVATALAASRLLLRQGRISDAIGQSRAALEIADASGADAARIVARGQLAGLLFAAADREGEYERNREAEQLLAKATRFDEQAFAPAALLEASIQYFELALEQADRDTARAWIAALCTTAERIPELAECARMRVMLALDEGRVADASRQLEQAAENFGKLGWTERLGELHRIEAELELRRGRLLVALDRLDASEHLLRKIGAANQLARSASVRGDVLAAGLEYAAAIEQYRSGLQHSRDVGDRYAVAHTLVRLAALLPLVGRFDAAEQVRAEAAALFTAMQDERGLAALDWASATAAWRTGDLESAAEQLVAAEMRYAALGDDDRRIEALAELARLHTARLDLQQARALLHRASTLQAVSPLAEARRALSAADLEMVESDFGAASALIARARTLLSGAGSSVAMLRVDLAQARLLLESGEAAAAVRLTRALLRASTEPATFPMAPVETGFAEERLAVVMVQAQALADQQRLPEARWTLDNLALAGPGRIAVELALRLEMLRAFSADGEEHVSSLQNVRDQALEHGYRLLALESDALLASVLMRQQRHEEATLLAESVSRSATEVGAWCVVDYLDRQRAEEKL